MWLEASIWLWGPLAGIFAAWTMWRGMATERELRRLHARLAELEADRTSPRRRAA